MWHDFSAHIGRRVARDDRHVVAEGLLSAEGEDWHGQLGFGKRDVVGEIALAIVLNCAKAARMAPAWEYSLV
ncbi:hypothetical protein [Achromobacter marplatensis]|uniref:hypothetical protein n=1 Tax=Achromobacter marplatensis TaxID=470868 RepID=UPI001303A555|nr:hypothetical protein [Achromobacter marplatensis]